MTLPDWRKMAVQITPTAIQHTGMTASPAGSVAAWQVTFQLDAEKLLRVAISIPVAGPTTHHEAQLEALKILQVFLGDACNAAKKYQFSNWTLSGRRFHRRWFPRASYLLVVNEWKHRNTQDLLRSCAFEINAAMPTRAKTTPTVCARASASISARS